MTNSTIAAEVRPSAWSPLRYEVFRALWIAGLVSDIGAWMHQVGEAWLMTTLSQSPLWVALLQSADSLAVFLFSIPAGALADIADRRLLAIFTQVWLMAGALALGLLTLGGAITPWLLLALSFMMNIGAALDAPVWQAIVPDLVPRSDLPQAVALGGVSINIARAVAPAVGGLLIASVGPYAVFFLNAATFVFVIAVLVRWRPTRQKRTLPSERLVGAVHYGLRYVRHSPELLAAFAGTGTLVFCGSCVLALLPVFARRELSLDSAGYGLLYGSFGLGAILSVVLLPKILKKLSSDAILALGSIAFGVALLALATIPNFWWAAGALLIGGIVWLSILTCLNVLVQAATPSWVRARVLSVYVVVFQGAIALGSLVWGALASRTNVRAAFVASGATMLVGALIGRQRWFRQSGRAPDLTPSLHWPKPVLVWEPTPEDGPVLISTEYRVATENQTAFIRAADHLRRRRQRSGAYQWQLFCDPAVPERLVEIYQVDSWGDHLRQHERVTVDERNVEARLGKLLLPGTVPVTTHLIAARTGP